MSQVGAHDNLLTSRTKSKEKEQVKTIEGYQSPQTPYYYLLVRALTTVVVWAM